MLSEACAAAADWPVPISVGVNFSTVQLGDHHIVEQVEQALRSSGLAPARLTIEVTETSMMTAPLVTAGVLDSLRTLGAKVAIDDFGTGHSSLAYLESFDVDIIKIDQAFVAGLHDGRTQAMVRAIVRLATDLGVPTVAEGIEDYAQLDELRALGCTYGQGYLLGKPTSASDLVRQLAQSPATTAQSR